MSRWISSAGALGAYLYLYLALWLCCLGWVLGVPQPPPKAVYFQTDDPISNAVVAVGLDPATGMLTSTYTVTATGGEGGALVGLGADPLLSQGSVTTGHGYVFVVNAGSSTLSMLSISATNATQLTLVGQPASTLGDFPVSVAYSAKLRLACVVNTGARDGVTCFRASKRGLEPRDAVPRPLHLNQTTPPQIYSSTSQVLFNPQSTVLFVMVKGAPSPSNTSNATPGFLAGFRVGRTGTVSHRFVKTPAPRGSLLMFGSAFVSNTRLVSCDVSAAVAVTADIGTDLAAHEVASTPATGTTAIGRASFSPLTNTVFLADGGSGIILELDPFTPGAPVVGAVNASVPDLLEMAVGAAAVYAVSPKCGCIVMFDISGGKGTIATKQVMSYSAVGIRAMGMAIH